MSQSDPFAPVIAWRRGRSHPEREPNEIDVRDGRAEYQLSGPYRMSEGSKIEIIRGKVVWSAGGSIPT